jgi:hypothetical protein
MRSLLITFFSVFRSFVLLNFAVNLVFGPSNSF